LVATVPLLVVTAHVVGTCHLGVGTSRRLGEATSTSNALAVVASVHGVATSLLEVANGLGASVHIGLGAIAHGVASDDRHREANGSGSVGRVLPGSHRA